MAPHSSTLAWKIAWTEEPGRLQSMGSWRVRHDWATALSLFTFMHWRRKWQPTPEFLPGESQGRESLVGCRLWGCRVGHDWSDLAAAAAVPSLGASQVVLVVKNPPANAGDIRDAGSISGLGRSPGGEQGNHSSILAWRIPWTQEPGGLQSIGWHKVGHDWGDLACTHAPSPRWTTWQVECVCGILVPTHPSAEHLCVTTEPERMRWGGGLAQSACNVANYLHLRSSLSRKRHRQI